MELEGIVAIVTGAGNGIGAAIARKLFDEGASVALWDMNLESVQKLAAELDPRGARAAAFQVDVTAELDNDFNFIHLDDYTRPRADFLQFTRGGHHSHHLPLVSVSSSRRRLREFRSR